MLLPPEVLLGRERARRCQIASVMEWQRKITAGELPQQKQLALMPRLNDALEPGATPEQQSIALALTGAIVGKIRDDVEAMRRELLTPLEDQQAEVLGAIDSAYEQIHYANSIVTGHLASVVAVHDAQDELFAKAGVSKSLRSDVGKTLADASQRIGDLVDHAATADDKIADASKKAQELQGGPRRARDAISPGITDLETYDRLITVVKEASRVNLAQADLKKQIEKLGDVAVKIAKRVPAFAAILA